MYRSPSIDLSIDRSIYLSTYISPENPTKIPMTSGAAEEEYPLGDCDPDTSDGSSGPKRKVTVTSFDETNVVMCGLTVKVGPPGVKHGKSPKYGKFLKIGGLLWDHQDLGSRALREISWENLDEFR